MRTFLKLFCGLVFVAAVIALPADPRTAIDDSDEVNTDVERVPIRPYYGGIFEDMLERMRQQMLYLLSAVPRFGRPENGNTTSVTKIIDGHKVTINETVYSSGDGENVASVVKVRVVDVRPEHEDGVADAEGEVETVEQSNENEIYTKDQQKRKVHKMEAFDMVANPGAEYPSDDEGHRERMRSTETIEDVDNGIETFDKEIETFDEPDNKNLERFDDDIESFDDIEGAFDNSIEDNEIEVNENRRKPIYLGNDLRVNDFAARQPHPDVEIISFPNPPRDLSRDTYINTLAAMEGRSPHPDAEIFEPMANFVHEGKDLSEDTLINEIAPGNVPYNPDAEFIIDNSPNSRYYYRTENR